MNKPYKLSINGAKLVNDFIGGAISLLSNELAPYNECVSKIKDYDNKKISKKEFNKWLENNFYDYINQNNELVEGNNPENISNRNAVKWLSYEFNLNNDISLTFKDEDDDIDSLFLRIKNKQIQLLEGDLSCDYGLPGIIRMSALLNCFKDLKEYIKKEN